MYQSFAHLCEIKGADVIKKELHENTRENQGLEKRTLREHPYA